MSDVRPIGVLDSGVGGLTVLREMHRSLPEERLIYLADLAHFPYGPRYQHEVRAFALRIIEHLIGLDVKLVVVACNTATAAALNAARELFDIPVVGVIAPGAQAAVEATHNGRVAVISTAGTHASQEYVHAIREANPSVGVLAMSAPELVEIVEAGEADTPRADVALRTTLAEVFDWGADTLVLGCTHYPMLGSALARVAGDRLQIVDSAKTTTARVERVLSANRLAADTQSPAPEPRLLVTSAPEQFAAIASLLFGDRVGAPEVVNLWPATSLLPTQAASA